MDNEQKPPRHSGSRNREIGHDAERKLMNVFKELGYSFCRTTRDSSHTLDKCGIDLDNIPIIIQSKAGAQKGMQHAKELEYIDVQRAIHLPPDNEWHKKPKVLVHTKPPGRGKERTKYHQLAIMTFDDFITLFKLAFPQQTVNNDIHNSSTSNSGILPEARNQSESIEIID